MPTGSALPALPSVPESLGAGRPGARRAWGVAAVLAAFVFYPAAQPNTRQADVVISAGDSLVLARSDSSRYPLVIRAADGGLRGVTLKQPRPAWYTEGVYSGGKAYLLDAANEQLVVLNMSEGKVEQTYPAPGGAAGLAVQNGSVFVKSAASGEMRIFKGDSCFINKLAKTTPMPQAEYMDAVLPLPDRILTTQHATGQIFRPLIRWREGAGHLQRGRRTRGPQKLRQEHPGIGCGGPFAATSARTDSLSVP